jgi:membrane protein YqaA with SNARE-associated domain
MTIIGGVLCIMLGWLKIIVAAIVLAVAIFWQLRQIAVEVKAKGSA